jgi:hypothetical protein
MVLIAVLGRLAPYLLAMLALHLIRRTKGVMKSKAWAVGSDH